MISGWWKIDELCKPALDKICFSDIQDISSHDMNSICESLIEGMKMRNNAAGVPQLYVHELDSDDNNCLVSSIFVHISQKHLFCIILCIY